MTDALYGLTPDTTESFGISLGTLAPRGERNVLVASLDSLLRIASNPFFPYMLGRIEQGIDGKTIDKTATVTPTSYRETRSETAWSFKSWIAMILGFTSGDPDPYSAAP